MKIFKFIDVIFKDFIKLLLYMGQLILVTCILLVVIGVPLLAILILNIFITKDLILATFLLIVECMLFDVIVGWKHRDRNKQNYFKNKWNNVR